MKTDLDWRRHDLSGVRVLLVEDEPDARGMLRAMLEACGATVFAAASAAEALALLSEARPDVLITDLNMPQVDGYELLARVRAREPAGAPPLPAVLITALPLDRHYARALDAGFADVLRKPLDFDTLCGLLVRLSRAAGR